MAITKTISINETVDKILNNVPNISKYIREAVIAKYKMEKKL